MASVFMTPGEVRAVDEARLLDCIAALETGSLPPAKAARAVGRHGERSAWQITPAVWATYSDAPFSRASRDARLANAVAAAHLRWLALELARHGRVVDAYTLALAWNGGLRGFLKGHAPARAINYAERAQNLYYAP